MDAIDIPADNVPEGLKACEQILKRSREVKKVEPVVAYWCCFSAAQKALKVQNRSKAETMFLVSLLDVLEEMKALLADNDAIQNEAAGAAYVENFALKVFMSADNDDRNGVTGKATIRKFVVAGQFIEVLKCFENGMTEEMEQKLQYARWKAADGAKALREGRTPTPGPPIPDIEPTLPELPAGSPSGRSPQPGTSPNPGSAHLTSPPATSPRPSPAGSNKNHPLPPNINTSLPAAPSSDSRTPQRTNSSASGAWSTVATPGVPDDDDEFEDRRFPSVDTLPDTATTRGTGAGAGDDMDRDLPTPPAGGNGTGLGDGSRSPAEGRKNVRFMGPDGAPLSPAQTHFTIESYDPPVAPPPSVLGFDTGAGGGGGSGSPRKGASPSLPANAGPGAGSGSGPGSGSGSGSYSSRSASTPTSGGRTRGDSDATLSSQPTTATSSHSLRPGGGGNASGTGSNSGNANANANARTSPAPSVQSHFPPPAPPPSLASYPGGGGGGGIPTGSSPRTGHNGLQTSPPPSAPPLHAINNHIPPPTSSPLPSPTPPAAQANPTAPLKPGRKTIEACQKHARWAVSALEFDDPETARNELRKALALLGG